jgi:hypothetical protein
MLIGLYSVVLVLNICFCVLLCVDMFVATDTAWIASGRSQLLEWVGLGDTWGEQYIFQNEFVQVVRDEPLQVGTMILLAGDGDTPEDWMLCEGQVLRNTTAVPAQFSLNLTHWQLPDMTGDREIRGGMPGARGGNVGSIALSSAHLPPHEHKGVVSSDEKRLDFSHRHIVDTKMSPDSGRHSHGTPDVLEENDVRSEWVSAPHTHEFECELNNEQHQHPIKQQFITHTADQDVNPRDGEGIWSRTFFSAQAEKKGDDWMIPVLVTSGTTQRLPGCPGFTMGANVSHAHEAVGMSRLHPFHGGIKSYATGGGEQTIGLNEQDTVRFGHAHEVLDTTAQASEQSNEHVHVITGNTFTSGEVGSCGQHTHTLAITHENNIQDSVDTSIASVVQPWVAVRCMIKVQ